MGVFRELEEVPLGGHPMGTMKGSTREESKGHCHVSV